MGNKIVQIGSDNIAKDVSQSELFEVYKDIDMIAKHSPNTIPSEMQEWEYLAYLIAERGTTDPTVGRILTERFTDTQQAELFLKYVKRKNYDDAKRLYKKMSKWFVNRNVNVNAVKDSLYNIFTWIPGERIINPEFGSQLRKLLYEGITDYNVEQIIAEINHCVTEWEPRVQIVKIIDASNTDDVEDNTVHLEIIFTILGLSEEQYSIQLDYDMLK